MERDIARYTNYKATSCGEIIGQRGTVLTKVLKKNGYFHFSRSSGHGRPSQTLVHRFVYEYFNGPIPAGLVVDHIDGDRLNNSVENLQLLSPKDNCRKGKLLTLGVAREIRRRRAQGESGRALAKEFGVSEQTICDVVKFRKWKEEVYNGFER